MTKFIKTFSKIINIEEVKEIVCLGLKIIITTNDHVINIDKIELYEKWSYLEEKVFEALMERIVEFLNNNTSYQVFDLYKEQEKLHEIYFSAETGYEGYIRIGQKAKLTSSHLKPEEKKCE